MQAQQTTVDKTTCVSKTASIATGAITQITAEPFARARDSERITWTSGTVTWTGRTIGYIKASTVSETHPDQVPEVHAHSAGANDTQQ